MSLSRFFFWTPLDLARVLISVADLHTDLSTGSAIHRALVTTSRLYIIRAAVKPAALVGSIEDTILKSPTSTLTSNIFFS